MPIDLKAVYPNLINLLLDPVFVVDEHGVIVFASEPCERLLGYTASEMQRDLILNYIHPDDLERTLAAASRVRAGQPHTDFENRYLHKDGSVVHILWSARWSEDHQLRIAVARDVTALRRANQIQHAMYRISEVAFGAETLRALCDGVRRVIGELFPSCDLYLAFYDATNDCLRVPDWSTDQPDSWELNGWIEGVIHPETALADVIRTRQALRASRDPKRQGVGRVPGTACIPANWMGVPFFTKDAELGVLAIEDQLESTGYNESDQELLQFLATQVATVIGRKRAEEHLRLLAHHDPLTGLTNRSLLYDRLETSLRSESRHEGGLALLYLDLNNFKKVNDTHGHEAGDQLLTEVARRLELCTRNTDTVARMGGDEFTVLLTDIHDYLSLDTAVAKIRDVLAPPVDLAGQVFAISCSIGAALYPEDGETARQLLASADARMYSNKRGS